MYIDIRKVTISTLRKRIVLYISMRYDKRRPIVLYMSNIGHNILVCLFRDTDTEMISESVKLSQLWFKTY